MTDDPGGGAKRPDLAAVSIEQLLEAERVGERRLAVARQDAKLRVEEAYKEAQLVDRRNRQRIEALNKAVRAKNERLVEEIESEAQTFNTKSTGIDHMREALLAAASRLAARLTSGES